ncbi:omptin family outer membrane protease (plasmid) [Sinorhizobium meliloti WSM1022]|nr:hypothetical protein CDO23_25375 [Sinorhizobium meliloti]QKN18892.1 omptin family outer membrane protease [Sinorhizobium meliloti WSM1022]MDW9378506.1 omptin family outer membrane protease [Sinorhizobium meliloti]MDW9496841.1 omptin family outer membrane protease [Sinorhizobium meliloti]MDW9565483.1 omptin family outer membrane protease [Sinorhizobium meliloti]
MNDSRARRLEPPSIHPVTELDHYITAAIELNRLIYGNESSSIAVGAGMRHTDVKWTAYGGSGIYSNEEGFRKGQRKAPDWEKASATGKRFRWASSASAANTFSAILPSAAPFRVA